MATKTTEESQRSNYSFGDWRSQSELRISFIMKVYTILTGEAFISTFFCLLSLIYEEIQLFQLSNKWLAFILGIVAITIPILAAIYGEPFKEGIFSVPLLLLQVLSQAYVVAFICILTNPKLILMVTFMSFAFLFALTLYCFISRNEFSALGGVLFCSFLAVLLFFVFVFLTDNSFSLIMLSALWVVLFGMYVIYDTLLMLGNPDNRFTQQDYVLASFWFFTDIFVIFASMFQIFSFVRNLREEEK